MDVRRGAEDGSEMRVTVDLDGRDAAVTVTMEATRSEHVVPRARIEAIVARLGDAVVPAVAVDPAPTIAAGYELVLTTGMSQSIFRWVSTTPVGWEPLADAAEDLLRLAKEVTQR